MITDIPEQFYDKQIKLKNTGLYIIILSKTNSEE